MIVNPSLRIKQIANMVRFRRVVDIGCDHALLPIFLLQSGRIDFAIATDIAKEPLEKGRKNAILADVDDDMRFVLSDGLAQIALGNVETCIIAGVGGETVMKILENDLDVAKSFGQLILSPQRDVPAVRRFLHSNGFKIVCEELILDDSKFYHILDCEVGLQKPFCNGGYAFGRDLIKRKHPVLRSFIHSEMEKFSQIDMELLPYGRKKEIADYLRLCDKVLGGI